MSRTRINGVTSGNTTMLPALKLPKLEHVSQPGMRLLGYDGTNFGYQFVQDAYQRGDWDSNFPRSTTYKFSSSETFYGAWSLIKTLTRFWGCANHNSTPISGGEVARRGKSENARFRSTSLSTSTRLKTASMARQVLSRSRSQEGDGAAVHTPVTPQDRLTLGKQINSVGKKLMQ